jgi:hypothetical protein
MAVIPHEKRMQSQKLNPHAEKAKLLAVLGNKTYLIYLPARNFVTKTSFIKLYKDTIREGASPDAHGSTAREGEDLGLDGLEVEELGTEAPELPEQLPELPLELAPELAPELASEAPELGSEGELDSEASEAESFTTPDNEPLPLLSKIPPTNVEVAVPQFSGNKSEYEPVPMEIDYTAAHAIY